MEIRHGHVRQELPDEWWEAAGMVGFVPARAAYRVNAAPYRVERVFEVPIDHVEPLERTLSHGIFNDSHLFGTARERVVSILKGFREDSAIPPVHVVRLGPGRPLSFQPEHRCAPLLLRGGSRVQARLGDRRYRRPALTPRVGRAAATLRIRGDVQVA